MSMTIKEYEEKARMIAKFRSAVDLYRMLMKINSVHFYYNGHQTTSHPLEDSPLAGVAKEAVISHQREFVKIKYDELRHFNIDATGEMPVELM